MKPNYPWMTREEMAEQVQACTLLLDVVEGRIKSYPETPRQRWDRLVDEEWIKRITQEAQ